MIDFPFRVTHYLHLQIKYDLNSGKPRDSSAAIGELRSSIGTVLGKLALAKKRKEDNNP